MVLIRLRICAGWSAPLVFANPRRQVLSRRGPFVVRRQLFALHDNSSINIGLNLTRFSSQECLLHEPIPKWQKQGQQGTWLIAFKETLKIFSKTFDQN